MKRILTFLTLALLMIHVGVAQSSSEPSLVKSNGLSAASPATFNAYNYGRTVLSQNNSQIYKNVPLFPDSAMFKYAAGPHDRVFTHYVATLLDPTSQKFGFAAQSGVDMIITRTNAYVVDSVVVPINYRRNLDKFNKYSLNTILDTTVATPDTTINGTDTVVVKRRTIVDSNVVETLLTQIVDTFLVELFNNNTVGAFVDTFLTDTNTFGVVPSIVYQTDTLKFKSIKYNAANNRVIVPGATQHKLAMDSTFFATQPNAEGIYNYSITSGDNISAGKLVGAGLTFIPGYDNFNKKRTVSVTVSDSLRIEVLTPDTTITGADTLFVLDSTFVRVTRKVINVLPKAKRDSLEFFNYIEIEAFEEAGNAQFPDYIAKEFSNTYEVGDQIRYNDTLNRSTTDSTKNKKTFRARLDTRYLGNKHRQIENLDVFFYISCATCNVKGTAVEDKGSIEMAELYPNPLREQQWLNVSLNLSKSQNISVSVVDAMGRVVDQTASTFSNAGPLNLIVNTANLEHGIYFVEVKGDSDKMVKRFIK